MLSPEFPHSAGSHTPTKGQGGNQILRCPAVFRKTHHERQAVHTNRERGIHHCFPSSWWEHI